MSSRLATLAGLFVLASTACDKGPPELKPEPAQTAAVSTAKPAEAKPTDTAAPEEPKPNFPPGKTGDDPNKGSFTLAEATKELKGTGAIVATIDTSKGALQCKLFDDKAPVTVANFIGLATGKRAWKDARSNTWVNRPAYDGTTFHRIIKGFMIQGGDQLGNGTGEPGYVIKDEIWEGSKHDRPGLLCMANRGKNTNGAQFFITDAGPAHLDGGYTIFGECAPVELVHDIANTPIQGERPTTPIKIKSVTISRDEKKK